jgi:hypothetical protein
MQCCLSIQDPFPCPPVAGRSSCAQHAPPHTLHSGTVHHARAQPHAEHAAAMPIATSGTLQQQPACHTASQAVQPTADHSDRVKVCATPPPKAPLLPPACTGRPHNTEGVAALPGVRGPLPRRAGRLSPPSCPLLRRQLRRIVRAPSAVRCRTRPVAVHSTCAGTWLFAMRYQELANMLKNAKLSR